jgi:hypothetical protein
MEMAIKAVFFDARDTLGEVDQPGHLVAYRPSTEKLLSSMKALGLRLACITNLPDTLTAEQGKQMITGAVLDEQPLLTIGDFIAADDIITNHEAGSNKPDERIYLYAARKLGLAPEHCLFVGENLIEVLGARAAGFQAELKPCPPGREFQPAPLGGKKSPTDSGRAFEAFFEHEHLLGERIFACGDRIVAGLATVTGDQLPDNLRAGIGFFVYMLDNFADQVHLRAEEACPWRSRAAWIPRSRAGCITSTTRRGRTGVRSTSRGSGSRPATPAIGATRSASSRRSPRRS